MSKKESDDKDDVTGVAGFTKIARGLSDLFNVLSDFDQLPHQGRHEKDGKVFEYRFGTRTILDSMGDAKERPSPTERSSESATSPRRAAKRTSLEVLEPVTDVFDEAVEIVMLFELPGVERKDVRCVLDGDILLIEAQSEDRLYRKEMLIEAALAEGGPRVALRNGVLEVRLSKKT